MKTMKASKRTDIHRPGFLKPSEYTEILCFAYPRGGLPGINLDYLLAMRTGEPVQVHMGLLCAEYAIDPATGKRKVLHLPKERFFHGKHGGCDICGANFIEGSVFKHEPTGECIIVGHICAEKLGFESDNEEWVKIKGVRREASFRLRDRRHRWSLYRAELARLPELRHLFKIDHHVIKNIRERFRSTPKWGISEKQFELLKKIEEDLAKPAEILIAAPIADGRQTIEGEVVSTKWQESDYGDTPKMVVKVRTLQGNWLAWATIPGDLLDQSFEQGGNGGDGSMPALRGATIRFTATLSKGREPHFAIAKRPSNAVLVMPSPLARKEMQRQAAIKALEVEYKERLAAAPEHELFKIKLEYDPKFAELNRKH